MSDSYLTNKNLEKFLSTVPGTADSAIDVDSIIDVNGDLKKLVGINAILKSILNALLISRGTYFLDPSFGTLIYKKIFEPADMKTYQEVQDELNLIAREYETRAKISFDVAFFSNKKGFRIDLIIEYEGKTKTVNIDFDETLLTTVSR